MKLMLTYTVLVGRDYEPFGYNNDNCFNQHKYLTVTFVIYLSRMLTANNFIIDFILVKYGRGYLRFRMRNLERLGSLS